MPSLPSKLLDDATNADFANLEIDIAVICSRIMAMFIFRLKQSTFAASSRSLLVGKGMLAAFADGHDAVAGGGLGELLPEGCTLAGAEVVVRREGAPDCSCEACSLCWRNSKGKREEQLLNWSANTRRMALGDGGASAMAVVARARWSSVTGGVSCLPGGDESVRVFRQALDIVAG